MLRAWAAEHLKVRVAAVIDLDVTPRTRWSKHLGWDEESKTWTLMS
jgi:hypothetical protein